MRDVNDTIVRRRLSSAYEHRTREGSAGGMPRKTAARMANEVMHSDVHNVLGSDGFCSVVNK